MKELKIQPIKNGTVIDHITPGNALKVLKILKIPENTTDSIVSAVMRNYEVAEKHRVVVPDEIVGIVKCANPNCISNSKEPIQPRFIVKSRDPLRIKCFYCERELKDISSGLR